MAIQREYLSPNEIAEYLGVSPFTIRRYIKLGELRAVKLLGGFRVHREELQRFLKAHEVNPSEEELAPEEAPDESPVAPGGAAVPALGSPGKPAPTSPVESSPAIAAPTAPPAVPARARRGPASTNRRPAKKNKSGGRAGGRS